jgi:hypothetical protein
MLAIQFPSATRLDGGVIQFVAQCIEFKATMAPLTNEEELRAV